MLVRCEKCRKVFEDCYRSTICPHGTFPANDGMNNFLLHPEAYLADEFPKEHALGQQLVGEEKLC